MRELTYVARRTVEWREAPGPALESDRDAIVAPVAATSCDVDSAILAGHAPIPPPFAIGHECVARVVVAGDAISHVSPGDLLVTTPPQAGLRPRPTRSCYRHGPTSRLAACMN